MCLRAFKKKHIWLHCEGGNLPLSHFYLTGFRHDVSDGCGDAQKKDKFIVMVCFSTVLFSQ